MRAPVKTVPAVLTAILAAAAAPALEPGRAAGTLTVDAATVQLTHATLGSRENLFDDSKRDTVVVLSDRPLDGVAPDDEVELSLRARTGALTALALRVDGAKLVNVGVFRAGVDGVEVLPGKWFEYRQAKAGAGTLHLARRENDDHAYACAVEFVAAPPAAAATAEAPTSAAPPEPTPTVPPATTSTVDPRTLTPLLVAAIMRKDEAHALTIVAQGVDPNARDQYGVPVLNWAVMTCMPALVKALVEKGADLKYERAPGMTIMQEAGACPEAAKILKAAGAR